MTVWWIDGIYTDKELVAALRYESENEVSSSMSRLLDMAAERIEAGKTVEELRANT